MTVTRSCVCVHICVCVLAVGFPLIFPVGRKMTAEQSLLSDAGLMQLWLCYKQQTRKKTSPIKSLLKAIKRPTHTHQHAKCKFWSSLKVSCLCCAAWNALQRCTWRICSYKYFNLQVNSQEYVKTGPHTLHPAPQICVFLLTGLVKTINSL